MKALKFIIIGSGNISNTYCQAINKIADAELVGIISRSGKRPCNASKNIPIVSDLSEVSCDYDAVIIATPNGIHNQGAIQAAKDGKHVLVEKPLDISRDAMTKMIDACKENNVQLGVCYQYRSNPDIMIIKEFKSSNIRRAS